MEFGGYGKMDPEYLKILQGQAKMASIGSVGELGLDLVGGGIQAYGQYQAYQEAQRRLEEERRQYEEKKKIEAEERRKRDQQQQRQNDLSYGNYAQAQGDRRNQAYQGYAARIGL